MRLKLTSRCIEAYDDNADDDGGVKDSTDGLGIKNISTKAVPTALFGGLVDKDQGC